MKTFVIGDMHGAYKALIQCLERASFDRNADRLIVLGDVCDGFPEVDRCIDALLKLDHCEFVIGNHDVWALAWALNGDAPEIWTSQGGEQTIASYHGGPMPEAHIDFLQSGKFWIQHGDQLFVHGGFHPGRNLSSQSPETLVWDRTLLETARRKETAGHPEPIGPYRDIFIGHTPAQNFGFDKPMHVCNVWNVDTGAGWSGKLTIMEAESKQFWQSDPTPDLYGHPGRE